ncbi:replication protein [Paenibacillus koleovorans]|uniref:replication protein n=1 Tax=Paenibacillus koleovorans TaxID=121608 RepID=UPI000FD7947C|nr:replication protein [Paenibacillus koleovorans]
MESAVNPQPDDPHLRISHQVHREMIRRKFTQRQRNIIDFILTLSWGCGKPSAVIPRLKDFKLCGVGPNHIRKELQALFVANVVFWEGATNHFQVNKHYDKWDVPVNEHFNPKELNDLIRINLEHRPGAPNLAKKLPESGTKFPDEEESSHIGKLDESKEQGELPDLGSENFPIREADETEIPCGSKADELPKERVKEINVVEEEVVDDESSRYQKILTHFVAKRGQGLDVNDEDYRTILQVIRDGIPVDFVLGSIDRAFEEYVPKHRMDKINTFKFIAPRCYDEWVKYQRRLAISENVQPEPIPIGAEPSQPAQARSEIQAGRSQAAAGGYSYRNRASPGKPKLAIVTDLPSAPQYTPEQLEEFRARARKLDQKLGQRGGGEDDEDSDRF